LVKIDASGIGHFEHFLLSGNYNIIPLPYIPGTNGVGHVVKAGKNGQHLLGKRVIVAGLFGCWTEYAIGNVHAVIPIDKDVSMESAAFGFGNPFTAIGLLDTMRK